MQKKFVKRSRPIRVRRDLQIPVRRGRRRGGTGTAARSRGLQQVDVEVAKRCGEGRDICTTTLRKIVGVGAAVRRRGGVLSMFIYCLGEPRLMGRRALLGVV